MLLLAQASSWLGGAAGLPVRGRGTQVNWGEEGKVSLRCVRLGTEGGRGGGGNLHCSCAGFEYSVHITVQQETNMAKPVQRNTTAAGSLPCIVLLSYSPCLNSTFTPYTLCVLCTAGGLCTCAPQPSVNMRGRRGACWTLRRLSSPMSNCHGACCACHTPRWVREGGGLLFCSLACLQVCLPLVPCSALTCLDSVLLLADGCECLSIKRTATIPGKVRQTC